MGLIHPNPPPRPATVVYASIRELYLHFEDIFVTGEKSLVVSHCNHRVYCFAHHFFHMAGVIVEGIDKLSMPKEKEKILATTDGFAHYELRENGSRARHLRSARETLESPDEIWAGNPLVASAKRVYIKEYSSKPYPFSVALVGEWETNSTIIVPFSSFPVAKKKRKKVEAGGENLSLKHDGPPVKVALVNTLRGLHP